MIDFPCTLKYTKGKNNSQCEFDKSKKGMLYSGRSVENMIATKPDKININLSDESNKLELYRLLGEGYKAMEEGRTSSIEDVSERFEKRRKNRND